MQKIHLGTIHADFITMTEAISAIGNLAISKKGGFVVTPNVDHVVLAERNQALRAAYADASLSLVDGMPLVWFSKILGFPLLEKISGSDIIRPLLVYAAEKALRVFFLGSAPGVGQKAAAILMTEIPGLQIVGTDAPPLGFDLDPIMEAEVMEKMLITKPDIILVALGAPKQELLMHRWKKQGISQVMLGIGASLDFIAGNIKRAPKWMSNMGLEWLFRLSQDPKRLIKRYLIQDMGIVPVFFRMLRTAKEKRVFFNN